MIIDILLLIVGLVLLAIGADVLVRGGSSLARHLGLTPLVVGLTVVAFGTSAPEMVVSVGGAARGSGDIAIGNVVGSNIFNVGFILGLAALCSPLIVKLGVLKLDVPIMIGVSVLGMGIVSTGVVSRLEGFLLILILTAYTVWSVRLAKKQSTVDIEQEFEQGIPKPTRSVRKDWLLIAGGLALLLVGSNLMLESAISLARAAEISDAVIGLTIVAAGTSMPELASTLAAALRKQSDIAIGNILGSNIFNILGILGLSSLVKPLNASGIQPSDLWVMIALSVVALPLLWTGRTMQRWEGALLLCGYIGYVWARWPT